MIFPPVIRKPSPEGGFTLIELSIVLVIIGLIVGGVLVGQDLVRAAGVRATITQVEKFNQAVNTFFGKYGALPGDLNAQTATTFGFTARGQYAGEGDGNGVIEGVANNGPGVNYGFDTSTGETAMFWVDLTTANGLNINLVEGAFSVGSPIATPAANVTGAAIAGYMPAAKIGGGNYFYAFSKLNGGFSMTNQNWYGLSAVTLLPAAGGVQSSSPALTVKQAYDIDRKVDDGLPLTGRVLALYVDTNAGGAAGVAWAPNAASPTVSTCYDTTSGNYSISKNGGAGVNCALSFRMQAGD